MDKSILPGVSKIALLRATALGDFIFALPAIAALHETYPLAEIVCLGREWHAAFVPGRVPGVTRVIAMPPASGDDIARGLVIDPAHQETFLAQLRAERFDIAVQMQGGGTHSNPFVSAFGARLTIGARAAAAPALDRWIPYSYYQSEVARLLDVAALAGAHTSTANLSPCLPVLASDLAAAAPLLEGLTGKFAVLHPGSTDPRRCWSPEKFAQVADYLHQRHGFNFILTGVDYEQERVAAVAQAMSAPARNLCGQLSLPALVGVLSRANLFVSNDTGPLHVGLAVGTPAVGLFWAEYIVNSLPLSRATFLPLISWQRQCPRCGSYLDKHEADIPQFPGCRHEVSFLEAITPEQVIEAVEHLRSA